LVFPFKIKSGRETKCILAGLMLCFSVQAKAQWEADSIKSNLYIKEGVASYYANRFHGRRTANGEIYSKNKLTAAHLTLPFNTKLKVTNLRNKKWVIVRVNDRGPYNRKRIIDLSYRAAKHLGLTKGKGIARVRVEEIPKALPPPKPEPEKQPED
jgi:rare lipoprotein A